MLNRIICLSMFKSLNQTRLHEPRQEPKQYYSAANGNNLLCVSNSRNMLNKFFQIELCLGLLKETHRTYENSAAFFEFPSQVSADADIREAGMLENMLASLL